MYHYHFNHWCSTAIGPTNEILDFGQQFLKWYTCLNPKLPCFTECISLLAVNSKKTDKSCTHASCRTDNWQQQWENVTAAAIHEHASLTGRLLVVGCGRRRCTRLSCYICRQVLQQFVFLRFTSKAEVVHFALKLHQQVCQVVVELQLQAISLTACSNIHWLLKISIKINCTFSYDLV